MFFKKDTTEYRFIKYGNSRNKDYNSCLRKVRIYGMTYGKMSSIFDLDTKVILT